MLNKLHIIITIIASIITVIFGIYLRQNPNEIITSLIIVIVVCYIIGLVAKLYLIKKVFSNNKNLSEKTESINDESPVIKDEQGNDELPVIKDKEGNDELPVIKDKEGNDDL